MTRYRKLLLSAVLLLSTLGGLSAQADESVFRQGQWLLVQKTMAEVKIPILKNVIAQTVMVSLYNLKKDARRVRGQGKVCDLRLTSNSSIAQMVIPQRFIRSLKAPKINAKLLCKAGQCKIQQPTQISLVGTHLKKKAREALPEKPKDPRVYDQDKDGKPGMTVGVKGWIDGEVYIAQRTIARWSGKGKRGGYEGKVRVTTEQNVLGASSFFLKRKVNPISLHDRSFFRLEPFSGTSCAQAKSRAKKILKEHRKSR